MSIIDKIKTEFNLIPIDNAYIFEVKQALSNNSLKFTQDALVNMIINGYNKYHLLFIGLCLRRGPDVNYYISIDLRSKKKVHFLIFVYDIIMKKQTEVGYLDSIIAMLVLSGSNLNNLAFENGDNIKVGEWLYSNGYTVVKKYESKNIRNVLSDKDKNTMGLILDDPSLINSINDIIKELLFKSLAEKVIEKYYKPSTETFFWMNNDMILAQEYYNEYILISIIKSGILPPFPLVDEWLFLSLKYFRTRRLDISDMFLTVLNVAIDVGLVIDNYQKDLIIELGGESLIDKYQEPTILKECNIGKPLSTRINDILYKFGTHNLQPKCDTIKELIGLGPENLKTGLILKQKYKIINYILSPKEILSQSLIFDRDISEFSIYPDSDFSYIRNGNTLKGYKADEFDKIIKDEKKNLPQIIDSIKHKKEQRIKHLSKDSLKIETFSQLVDELFKHDVPIKSFITGNEQSLIEDIPSFDLQLFRSALTTLKIDHFEDINDEQRLEDIYIWVMIWLKKNDNVNYERIKKIMIKK